MQVPCGCMLCFALPSCCRLVAVLCWRHVSPHSREARLNPRQASLALVANHAHVSLMSIKGQASFYTRLQEHSRSVGNEFHSIDQPALVCRQPQVASKTHKKAPKQKVLRKSIKRNSELNQTRTTPLSTRLRQRLKVP